MKIAVLGRTRMLLDAAERLAAAGHRIVMVASSRPAEFYDVGLPEFEALAKKHAAPFFGAADIGSPERSAEIVACGADLGISVNWPRILGERELRPFRLGVLNAHAGDLPRYRGNACPNWAILNGEPHVGLCVHFMEPAALDSGPVLARDKLPLTDETYIGDIYEWLGGSIPRLFERAVGGLADGSLKPQPQPTAPGAALRCYPRRPEDGRIDWSWDAARIKRLVRASSHPFAGAFTSYEGGTRITVWRAASEHSLEPFSAVPGQVMAIVGGDPVIACGAGALRLTETELESKPDAASARALLTSSLRARLR